MLRRLMRYIRSKKGQVRARRGCYQISLEAHPKWLGVLDRLTRDCGFDSYAHTLHRGLMLLDIQHERGLFVEVEGRIRPLAKEYQKGTQMNGRTPNSERIIHGLINPTPHQELIQVRGRPSIPRPITCPNCGRAHYLDEPHDVQSLAYREAFRAQHGRYPAWTDALMHVPEPYKSMALQRLAHLGIDVNSEVLPAKE